MPLYCLWDRGMLTQLQRKGLFNTPQRKSSGAASLFYTGMTEPYFSLSYVGVRESSFPLVSLTEGNVG